MGNYATLTDLTLLSLLLSAAFAAFCAAMHAIFDSGASLFSTTLTFVESAAVAAAVFLCAALALHLLGALT